jgi:AraC family transcriptional regulator
MLLNEFPDLPWLKRQINLRFQNRIGLNGRILKNPGWPSVLLNVKTWKYRYATTCTSCEHEIHRDHIKGPFSLFVNLEGSSTVQVNNRQVRVGTDYFFITNPGQEYSLTINGKTRTETANIHFGEYFVEQLVQSQTLPVEKLLEDKFQQPLQSFAFHNRLIAKTQKVNELIHVLFSNQDELREEELLAQLFLELFNDELKLRHSVERLPSVKKATRDELVKRILMSVDYIYQFYNQSLSLDELARASALSKFHFLRLFKIVMGTTPHQFITSVRINKAVDFLKTTQQEVRHIARTVGFADSSSFSRTFYRQMGVYPSQYKA